MKKKFRVIGERIQELRQAKGWSQRYLASRLGIVGSHLADLERGHKKPTNTILYALSDLLCVPVTDIYPDIDYEEDDFL